MPDAPAFFPKLHSPVRETVKLSVEGTIPQSAISALATLLLDHVRREQAEGGNCESEVEK